MQLTIQFNTTDTSKLRSFQKDVPHIFEDTLLRKQVGQLLAAQGKRNIVEQSPDGTSKYKELNSKYRKYKGFDLILIGRTKNTQTKRGTTNNRGRQSGILKKSLDWSMGSKDVVYLTAISYAKYLQEERPIFSIREENKADIMVFAERAFNRLAMKHN